MAGVETITYAFVGNASGLVGAAGAATSALNSVEGAAGKTLGALGSIAVGAAKAALALGAISAGAAVAGMTSAVTAAAGFEKQISAIGSVANLTAEQMKAVSGVALQIGKDTKFGAAEAAAGIEELVKAGVSIEDVMNGAARSTADLAAAAGTDLKTAAEVASNAMNVFGKSGKDMAAVANTITGATNASAIDINDFKFSLASSGAVAASVGINFEDLATGIALMGNAGIKGSDAGTSLKTMMLNLQPSTKAQVAEFTRLGLVTESGANAFFTAEGKAKGLAEIAGVLQEATKGMTDQQKLASLEILFGSDAIRAATILTKAGAGGFKDLGDKMAGMDAGEQGRRRLDNLAGSMEQLKGTLETIQIMIGLRFTPVLKRMVDAINQGLGNAMPQIEKWADMAAAGLDRLITRAAGMGPALRGFSIAVESTIGRLVGLELDDYASGWDTLGGIIRRTAEIIKGSVGTAAGVIKDFAASLNVGSAAGGIAALIGGIVVAFKQIEPVVMTVGRAIVANVTDTFRFLTDRVLPPLVSIILQTAAAFDRTLGPAAAATGAVLRGIFGDTLDWLARTVWPPFLSIIEQTANFWTGTILPTLPVVGAALRTALGETVQWLATEVWPNFRVAADLAWGFISGTIIPGIPIVVRQLRELLGGALTWIGQTGWPALVKGATTAWAFLQDKVIPIVQDTYAWLKVKLPEAINTVVRTFETIKGKVGPIVEQALQGDIAGAIKNLGSAFAEFATLAAGWLGEQAAKIDWAAVWSQATGIATALATYVSTLAVDFATWLGEQVAAIDWASVWQRTVEAATALATYLSKQAVDFATWLGTEVAKIPWALVWQQIKDAATALATYLQTLAVDFATWLGQQIALIDWDAVWANTKLTASQVIEAIAMAVGRLDAELTRWLQTQLETTDWNALGVSFGQLFGGSVLTGGQTAVDELGPKLKPETIRKALADFFVGVFTGLWAEIGPILQKGLQDTIDSAIRAVTPTRPNWWPTAVPFPFGPQPGSGMEFPVTPGSTQIPGGGNVMSGTSGPVGNEASREQMIARTKQWAQAQGLEDPDLFAAQLMQESSFNVGARSSAGARGIGQFMPGTGATMAARLGVSYEEMVGSAELSMQAAAMHMRDLTDQFGSQERAMSAYFSGPGGGIHPEYVSAVRSRLPDVQGISTTAGVAPTSGGGNGMVRLRHKGTGLESSVHESMLQDMTNLGEFDIIGQIPQAATQMAGPAGAGVDLTAFRQTQQEWAQNARDANAICGPHLAALFADAVGRPPTPEEARALGEKMGVYSPTRGILAAGQFDEYATALIREANPGSMATVNQTPATGAAAGRLGAEALAGGAPLVGFNTPGHYFGATEFRAEDQRFNVGGTGTSLAGGKEWMTVGEMEALMGAITNVITLTNEAGTSFVAMGQQVAAATQEAVNMTPALSGIGAAIDPVVAGFTEGTVSVTGMTDAIIASAAQQGVGAESAAQYAAGLITQDQALQGVLTGFAATTPAAAELLAQLQAGTITTDQAAVAFAGLATTTATSTGAIVASTTAMQTGVQTSIDLMAVGGTTAITNMGTQILTAVTDTAGNTVTTWTDLAGNVISQTATMTDGVVLDMADMATLTAATTDEMAGTITTTVSDLAGTTVTTITDMAGNVVAQSATMADGTISAAEQMKEGTTQAVGDLIGDTQAEFKKIDGIVDQARGAMESMSGIELEGPDVGDIISEMRKVERAAERAFHAIKAVEGSRGGSKSGGGSNPFGKAAGGPVSAWTPYMVGEAGPELFVPTRDGTIIPNRRLRAGGSGGGRTDTLVIEFKVDGRIAEKIYVTGKDMAARRGRDS